MGGGRGGIESVRINKGASAYALEPSERMETSVPLEKFANLRNDEGGGNNDGQMKSGVNEQSNFSCPCNAL